VEGGEQYTKVVVEGGIVSGELGGEGKELVGCGVREVGAHGTRREGGVQGGLRRGGGEGQLFRHAL
ncbi:MAG: hypothetical protein SGPRY_014193, partial [Prymnesium sp.]